MKPNTFLFVSKRPLQALDAFIGFCDLNSDKEDFALGSCQVSCVVDGRALGPHMRKLTMREIFEDAAALEAAGQEEQDSDEALARWFL